jgi:hypothetical protein
MPKEIDQSGLEQRMAAAGAELSKLSSAIKELSVSFAGTAAQIQQTISFLSAIGLTLNGTSPTWDPAITSHALYVRKQRDELIHRQNQPGASTSRDTEA